MSRTRENHVKQIKSVSERQTAHIFSLVGPMLSKYTDSLCVADMEGEIRRLGKPRGLMGKGEG